MSLQTLHQTPYLVLTSNGKALSGRILAAELRGALETPRALGTMDFDDPDGTIEAAAGKGVSVQLAGGRRGGVETPLLTGIVYREPVREPGNQRVLRLYLADNWAATDPFRATGAPRNLTPQDVLLTFLRPAGITAFRLSDRVFDPQPLVMMDQWNLAKAVKEVERMWALDNSDQTFEQQYGLTAGPKYHWWSSFEGDGTFYWENWPDGPRAKAAPLELAEDDLIRLEREPSNKGEKGRIEMFFEPRLVPGLLVAVAGNQARVEERVHRFDGARFRTEVTYGPVP